METTDKDGNPVGKKQNTMNGSIDNMVDLIHQMSMRVLELQAGGDVVKLVSELQEIVSKAANSHK